MLPSVHLFLRPRAVHYLRFHSIASYVLSPSSSQSSPHTVHTSTHTGCSGDEYFTLEWRSRARLPSKNSEESGWQLWRRPAGSNERERVEGGGAATIEGLDPYVAYEVRAIAHNGLGSSAVGPSSGPIALGVSTAAMIAAPRASAISVASVKLGWAGRESECRPSQAWEVL